MSKPTNQHDVVKLFEQSRSIFLLLGDETRQQIIMLLLQTKRMSVNQIVEQIPLSRPAVSHHLRLLRDAQFVKVEKQGQQRLYQLDERSFYYIDQLEKLAVALKNCNKWDTATQESEVLR